MIFTALLALALATSPNPPSPRQSNKPATPDAEKMAVDLMNASMEADHVKEKGVFDMSSLSSDFTTVSSDESSGEEDSPRPHTQPNSKEEDKEEEDEEEGVEGDYNSSEDNDSEDRD